jgi:two-component system, NtrC family, response regulator HydG
MPEPIRLLIVDADDAIIRQLTQFLTSRGYRVGWADDDVNCLVALEEFPEIRVVLLDLGVGGTLLLRQIKEKRPDVAVILMTEPGDERLARQSIRLGALAHVTKPLDLSILENLVKVSVKGDHE